MVDLLQSWLGSKRSIAGGVLVALAGVLLWNLLGGPGGRSGAAAEPQAWFMDVETGELFPGGFLSVPPLQRENGHEAVRVLFYRCGDCVSGQEVGRLYEKFEDAGQLAKDPSAMEFAESGRLISFDGRRWYAAQGEEGRTLLERQEAAWARHCGEAGLQPCLRPAAP